MKTTVLTCVGELKFEHEKFKDVSDECKDLISNMLVKKKEDRYSVDQMLKHPWF